MKISNLPKAALTDKQGNITPEWHDCLGFVVNQLQTFLGDERYILPNHTSDTVKDLNDTKSEGGLLYDNEEKAGKINTDGKFKTLSTYDTLTTPEISAIPTGQRDGKFIRDSTTGELKVGINDDFKTVTLT